jgi:Uma2 family endonuclease
VGVGQWRTDFRVHPYTAPSGYRVHDIACHPALSRRNGIPALAYQDVEFALTDNDRVRPDVCVLVGDRARRLDPDRIPIPGSPDIAIEVISPTERSSESHDKVRAYLRHGTAEVWQVYPKSRTVQIHRGETSRFLEWGQQAESDLLPGFTFPLI